MLNISVDKDAGVIVPLLGNEIAPKINARRVILIRRE